MDLLELEALARVRREVASGRARSIRIEAGVSIAELSAVTGVDRATLTAWERGRRTPRAAGALRYARVLERLAVLTVGGA